MRPVLPRSAPEAAAGGRWASWLPVAILAIGLATVAAYLIGAWQTTSLTAEALVRGALVLAYLFAGTLAWMRRPEYLTGRLLVLAGFLVLVPALQAFTDNGALFALGTAFGGIHEAVLAYVLLTYPSGRPGPGINGLVARAAVILAILLDVADLLTREMAGGRCNPFCTDQHNPFLVVDLGLIVARATGPILTVGAVVVLALVLGRFLGTTGAARRALAPVLFAGGAGALLIVIRQVSFLLAAPEQRSTLEFINTAAGLGQTLIPLALGVGFLRSRMARAGVADLLVRAGTAPTLTVLEDAVGKTMHDPSVKLARWSASAASYLDRDGRPLDLQPDGTHSVTLIDGSSGPLAAMTHDPVLAEEGDLLPSVTAAVRIVLENDLLATSLQAQAIDAAHLPGGRVTMIYTDIERSTELLDRLRERYPPLLAEVRRIQRSHVRAASGTEIDSRGDEFFAAVPDATAAIAAAIGIDRELAARAWPEMVRVRVRAGLHTGEPVRTPEGYTGMDVHLAVRVGASGHGGQIVVSQSTREAVAGKLDEEIGFRSLGSYYLKGIPAPIVLYQLVDPGLEVDFPPLTAQPVPAA
jgi:class 3 adenylate cyclase